jgi:hypothetical protein
MLFFSCFTNAGAVLLTLVNAAAVASDLPHERQKVESSGRFDPPEAAKHRLPFIYKSLRISAAFLKAVRMMSQTTRMISGLITCPVGNVITRSATRSVSGRSK